MHASKRPEDKRPEDVQTGLGTDSPAGDGTDADEARAVATEETRVPGVADFSDKLKTFALAPLPHHLLSRTVYWLTRRRAPFLTGVIRRFVKTYDVDMRETVQPDLAAYDTFNAFFTRALRPEARPVATGEGVIVSPADGHVSGLARVRDSRVLQAKGHDYSLVELLGGDADAAARFEHGSALTVYLSPRDYHRLHMPVTGRLLSMTHVPGRLWSVGPHAVRALNGLFAKNERVIAEFDTGHGSMALVLVGALNVAAIETVWHGLVTPTSAPPSSAMAGMSRIDYADDDRVEIERGAEMGRFNMGSTIVALFEREAHWVDGLRAESPVKVGEAVGRIGYGT